jgi:hypothetical protein
MIFFMSLPLVRAYEVLCGAVIGALGFRGEKAARQFPVAPVIGHALAAGAFARAGFVGAGAAFGVGILFTVHERLSQYLIKNESPGPGEGGMAEKEKTSYTINA